MKKITTILGLTLSAVLFSQVGIGTETPRDQLDVIGNILLDDYLILTDTKIVTGNYNLLVRSEDSNPVGEVKVLNTRTRTVVPINKYTVKITNVDDVRVLKLNTGLDVSKYFVGLAEATFTGANIIQVSPTATGNTSTPVHGTYLTTVEPGTGTAAGKYVISLNFNGARTDGNANGTWDVSFIVYEKTLVKDYGVFTGSVSASANPVYSGVSTNTPAGLQ